LHPICLQSGALIIKQFSSLSLGAEFIQFGFYEFKSKSKVSESEFGYQNSTIKICESEFKVSSVLLLTLSCLNGIKSTQQAAVDLQM